MKISQSNRKVRGQVLIMTAFLIFVLFTLALSFFKLLPSELNSALRTKQTVSAQVLADSGVKEAKVWLESQPPQRVLTQAILDQDFNSGTSGDPIKFGDAWLEDSSPLEEAGHWSYQVRLEENPSGPYAYDVISTCYFEGEPVRQVRATLARENFSRYALFIDRWQSDLVMETSPGAVQGPFHTNEFFRLVVPSGFYGNSGDPFVSGNNGVMTHAGSTSEGSLPFVAANGDGNAYYSASSPSANSEESAVPYNEDGNITSRYNDLVRGGRSNLTATDHVLLPYSSDELYAQALAGANPSSFDLVGGVGLGIPTEASNQVSGGIFISGNVEIELSIDANGDQVHNFTQSIPQEAYRYVSQETIDVPVYGNVSKTLGVGDTYYVSNSVTQTVGVQKITGYQTVTRTVTRQVQTGQRYVSGGGTTVGQWEPTYQTVTDTIEEQVPIYDTVPTQQTTTVRTAVTIRDANDPRVGTSVTSREIVGSRQEVVDRVNEITPAEYEANPSAYPNATLFHRAGPPKTAKITEVSGPTPQTKVVDYEGNTVVLNGALNGVTFVDGSIESLKGVSKGAQNPAFPEGDTFQGRYIVANPAIASQGKMTITDDLLQFYDGDDSSLRGSVAKTLKIGAKSPTSQHALGLVSRLTFLKPAPNDPLNLYGVILAGLSLRDTENSEGVPQVEGGFGSHQSIMSAGYGLNKFHLFGGLVQANQMLWKTNNNGLTGTFTYDPAVAGDMPRFPRSNRVTTLRYADRYVNAQTPL